jgi:hypothetical protein
MADVLLPVQEPRCPHCMKPFRGSFPTDSDEAPLKCPACGKTSPASAWFNYEPEPDGIEDMDD